MNQAKNSIHGGDDQFGQDAPTTNPFTADLKGEFTSNFGTNTNAVSQIFKEGGFVNDRKRIYIAAGVILVIGVVVFMLFMQGSDDMAIDEESGSEDIGMVEEDLEGGSEDAALEEPGTKTGEEGKDAKAEAPADGAAPAEGTAPAESVESTAATDAAAGTAAPAAISGALSVVTPAGGQSRDYDEASEPATFQWEGAAQYLVFSKTADMQTVVRRVDVSSRQDYQFLNPHPGTWHWQLQAPDGTVTEPRAFTINAPQRLNLVVGQPAAGGGVAGNGGMVSWTAPHTRVAFYRVELSAGGSFAKPDFRFATSGTNVQLNGVTPGTYQLRLGGFSEVSGQWEYSTPINVTVQ